MIKSSKKTSKIETSLYSISSYCPLSPNMITIISIVFSIFAFIFVESLNMYYILGFVFLAFIFDAIDGIVARAKNQVSNKGAFLDGIADRIVELFILLTILKLTNLIQLEGYLIPLDLQIIFILFFGTCMASFIKAYSEHRQVLSHEKAVNLKGLLERAERVGLIFIALLLVYTAPIYSTYLIFLIFVLTLFTFLQRMYYVLN